MQNDELRKKTQKLESETIKVKQKRVTIAL